MAKRILVDHTSRLDNEVSEVTMRVLAAVPGTRAMMSKLLERQYRRHYPHPGGAAREFEDMIMDPFDPWAAIDVSLPEMRHGGTIRLVHRVKGDISLHGGKIVRVPGRHGFSDTMMQALIGTPVGGVIDLSETGLAGMADAPVTAIFQTEASAHSGEAMLIHTEARTVVARIGEMAA